MYTNVTPCISMHEQCGGECSGTKLRGSQQLRRTAILECHIRAAIPSALATPGRAAMLNALVATGQTRASISRAFEAPMQARACLCIFF